MDAEEQIEIAPLQLTGYAGSLDDMRLEARQITGGTGAFAISTDDAEESEATFAAAGKIIAHQDGTTEVPADGTAMITFANLRLFGLFVKGTGLGTPLGLDSDGSGSTIAFTFFRGLFDEVDPQRGGFRNKVQGVALLGGAFGISLDAAGLMGPDGSFERAGNDELLAWSEAWVSQAS